MTRTRDEVVIALAGQPNCGKSTLFNAAAGFKVNTANFAGTSVAYTETLVRFEGRAIRLIDLPGTYSISSFDPAEKVARDYLLSGEVDVVINVVDASLLSRSLELTIQLIEMGIPMVVCLNMMDEARRKGIEFDLEKFRALLGLRVTPVVAVAGKGNRQVFHEALEQAKADYAPIRPLYDRDVEECIREIEQELPVALREAARVNERFVIVRLLEMDAQFERLAEQADPAFLQYVRDRRKQLAQLHDWPEAGVLASHRHALVLDLYEQIATHFSRQQTGMREKIDRLLINPVGGIVVVAGSLLLAFYCAVFLGDVISGMLEGPFERLRGLVNLLEAGPLAAVAAGLADGLEAGAGIVLPYLIPLLVLLAVYEDTGLLPRIAFMVDGLLHHVGLHGKSVVPLILGYGCNVPAIMATRNLESARDRRITMLIIPFVTCSARSVVIIALAGKLLGGGWAAFMYAVGIGVTLGLSFLLSRFKVDTTAGFVMEVPPLRRPYPVIITKKVWLRLREFLVVAWPVILVSSVLLSLLSLVGVDTYINGALSPLTGGLLTLPVETGIVLFLGVFRKELTLVMLYAALGTTDILQVLSQVQVLVLVLFTVLYIPCLATLVALWKEGGWKVCLSSALINLSIALLIAGAFAQLATLV